MEISYEYFLELAKRYGYKEIYPEFPEHFFDFWSDAEVWTNGEHTIAMRFLDNPLNFVCVVTVDDDVYYYGETLFDNTMKDLQDAHRKVIDAMLYN